MSKKKNFEDSKKLHISSTKNDLKEFQKCKDSPVYFYNNYCKKEGQRDLTEKEYEDFVKQIEYQRNMPLKLRGHYKDKPLAFDKCFEKLPGFLKNGS